MKKTFTFALNLFATAASTFEQGKLISVMKSVKSLSKSHLAEGVYYAAESNQYIVRGKKNGRVTTLVAFKKKEDAELYLKQYLAGETK